MKNQFTIVLIVFLMLLINTTTVSADNTDPSGSALRAYVEAYLKNAPSTDALASKIKAMGGANSSGTNEWLCSLEVANTLSVAYNIWESRMKADSYYMQNFTKSQFIPLNIANYCITYSNACNHWTWNQDCIKNKFAK